jgi:uncharacterized phage protein (TIGR02218 family)
MTAKTLYAHLEGGATTVCRCWSVTRRDGDVFGFTDHDRDLSFGGILFKASSGLTARALQQTTGLSVDNTEALGALSDLSVREDELMAGLFDGAEVRSWLVNWAKVADRVQQFRGTFGEISRSGGAFRAELRGLTEMLNQPRGKVYQRDCSAVLGDKACGVNLGRDVYSVALEVRSVREQRVFRIERMTDFAERWFDNGRLEVLNGAARGQTGMIKADRVSAGARTIELWQELRLKIEAGDRVLLYAGCDKRLATCREKFDNLLNFRGFPHIPGEDWLAAFPSDRRVNDGGSLQE